MTIAAGFRCNEGIVLCADTQETITGYIKGYDGKITTYIFRNVIVSIAGSGTSDYIRTAQEKAIAGLDDAKDYQFVKKKLEQNLIQFFDEHMSRWAAFPESERPSVELLLGVSVASGGLGLFHWSGTSFHQPTNKAIGAGILLANTLIDEYCVGNLTLKQLSSLAIFILSKVKKHVDTCGGSTHMVVLRSGGDFALIDSREVEKIERAAEKIEAAIAKKLRDKISAQHLPEYEWLGNLRTPIKHNSKVEKTAK